MKGKYLYFAISALLGVLSSLIIAVPFILTAIVFFSLLFTYKKYSPPQLFLLIGVFLVFFLSAQHIKVNSQTVIPSVRMFLPRVHGGNENRWRFIASNGKGKSVQRKTLNSLSDSFGG